MKRILVIIGLTLILFMAEFFLFNLFGWWGTPNLILIAVVFFNLYSGIRFSLLAAGFGGLMKDAFSLEVFGTHIFALMVCACLATFIRRNFYQPGSRLSRAFAVLVASVAYFGIIFVLRSIQGDWNLWDAGVHIFLPQIVVTVAVTTFVIAYLKYWADRFQL